MGRTLAGGVPLSRPGTPTRRIAAVDIARTAALAAMVIYHFTYDLTLFQVIPPDVALGGAFRWLAVATAASFLYLAGIGLMLAHPHRLNLRRALERIAVIAAAAALVTLATYFAFPQQFVFFGILHAIAAASLVGLSLLRLPGLMTLAIAAATLTLPFVFTHPLFNHPALLWTGLATVGVNTVDFEPAFPWFAATFAGIATVQLTRNSGFWRPRAMSPGMAALGWPGRHSLAIYLLHQPILMATIWSMLQLRTIIAPA